MSKRKTKKTTAKKATRKSPTKKKAKKAGKVVSIERRSSGKQAADARKKARKESRAGKRKKHPKAHTDHELLVTPKKAKELIGLNYKGNRNLITSRVDMYAGELQRGLWMATGEPVIIDWYGSILNGQHRLAAIIKTGIPAKLDLRYGVDPAAYDVIDTGRARVLSDILPIENPRQVSSLYRLYLSYLGTEGAGYTHFGKTSPAAFKEDRPGAVEWATKHEKLLTKIINTCYRDKEARNLLRPPAVFMGFYFWVARKSPKEADDFFRILIDGVNYEYGKNDPIRQLREQIRFLSAPTSKRKGGSMPLWMHGAMIIKSWNVWMEGETIRQLRMLHTEKWPRMTSLVHRRRASRRKTG